MDIKEFSRKRLELLDDLERAIALKDLEPLLSERLENYKDDWGKYCSKSLAVIEELRLLGHNLWSHDYDVERRELWG